MPPNLVNDLSFDVMVRCEAVIWSEFDTERDGA